MAVSCSHSECFRRRPSRRGLRSWRGTSSGRRFLRRSGFSDQDEVRQLRDLVAQWKQVEAETLGEFIGKSVPAPISQTRCPFRTGRSRIHARGAGSAWLDTPPSGLSLLSLGLEVLSPRP